MTETNAHSKKAKPSREELQKMIDEKGYKYAGEHYGVADNTVRRWLMAFGVELKPKCELKNRVRQKMENIDGQFIYEKHLKGYKPRKKTEPTEPKAKKHKEPVIEPIQESTPEVVTTVVETVVKATVKKPVHEVVDLGRIRNRYSQDELMEFKDLIEAKIKEGFEAICILKEGLNRSTENGTDDTLSSGNAFEEGTASIERENMTELVAKKQKHLNALNGALTRIGNGTYGICLVTGKLIPKERLLAVPHATKCVEAKTDQDNGKILTPVPSETTVDSEDVQE